jgi:hypothetical protein
MTTLAESGRISVTDVEDERQRLELNARAWNESNQELELILTPDQLVAIDLFDQIQLAAMIRICREPRTLADAGRRLFSVSRLSKSSANDADRLRNVLARFGLSWNDLNRGIVQRPQICWCSPTVAGRWRYRLMDLTATLSHGPTLARSAHGWFLLRGPSIYQH